MKIATDEWQKTATRFVAFFDILGFKDAVLKNSHEDVLEKVTTVKKATQLVIDGTVKGLEMKTNLRSFIFSDSIFIFSKKADIMDFTRLAYQCRILLGFCYKNNIPLKGAISCGEITADFNESIFVGQPIIDAYLLHEELHMFGAIVDHNVEKRIREFQDDKDIKKIIDDNVIQYKAPTKNGKINHYCLKWPLICVGFNEENNYLNLADRRMLETFYTTASGKPRIYVDNTIEFIDFLIKKTKEDFPNIKTLPEAKITVL